MPLEMTMCPEMTSSYLPSYQLYCSIWRELDFSRVVQESPRLPLAKFLLQVLITALSLRLWGEAVSPLLVLLLRRSGSLESAEAYQNNVAFPNRYHSPGQIHLPSSGEFQPVFCPRRTIQART